MLPFIKMEGLGNDFILLDLRRGRPSGWTDPDRAAIALCDRHFGVGADGLLLIETSAIAAARMTVVNADGSHAEMCGNGLRCVAAYLAEGPGHLIIETGAGPLPCTVTTDLAGLEVEIDMGVPTDVTREVRAQALEQPFFLTTLSLANPHAVTFLADEPLREWATRYGPALSRDRQFPGQANVEFARLRDDGGIDLVVWERGAGLTLACGTGACATAYVAVLLGHRAIDQKTPVHLPGGTLHITVSPDGIRMRGPAREVFRGSLSLAALLR